MIRTYSKKRGKKSHGRYFDNSTQKWLPIETVSNGIAILKDGRYIKIIEILPVNFYLKSDIEQENIIYTFASYLKVAPDNIQIRINTERADTDEYMRRHELLAENEQNDATRDMIYDEINFVRTLSENIAVKKRFYIVFEQAPKTMNGQNLSFNDVMRIFSDEVYKAERYLSQCELGVIEISDDGQLIDLLYGFLNKQSSRYIRPGNFTGGMFDEIHSFEGGKTDE